LAGAQLGVVGPIIATAARWLVPWLAVSGGVALTSLVTSNALPQVPINKKNIGLASALIGGGGAAYFVSEGLPEQHRPWAYAAAVAGIASGLYFLFQEPPPPPPVPPSSPMAREEMPTNCRVPGTPKPNENLSPAMSGIRVNMDLDQDRVGGLKRNKYADQDYAFEVRNLTQQPKCFVVGLNIRDDDGNPMTALDNQTFPGGKSPIGPSIYGRQEVFLQPGEYKSMTLKAPGFGSAWMPLTSFNQTVQVELFRNLRDVFPFQESDPIQVNGVPPYLAPVG
jgi:hypothetical protein